MSWGDFYLSHAALRTGTAIPSFTFIMIGITHDCVQGFLSVFVQELASFTHLSVSVSISFLSWIPQACLTHQLPLAKGSFVIHISINLRILRICVIHQFSVGEQVPSHAHAGLLHQLHY
jgi:hypothetical protein